MKNCWSLEEDTFLIKNYPQKGLNWCVLNMDRTSSAIRHRASFLKLKQDRHSDFFKEWQKRAASSKIGKKRPEQAEVIKKLRQEGKLKITEEQRKATSERMKNQWKVKSHPRGALGLKHSEESKQKMSIASKNLWENMTEEEKDKRSKRASILGSRQNINRANASWKAEWREIGGVNKYYRSRWEANYAHYLEWLKKNNQIKSWEHEPKTFWFEGIKRGVMSYLPDFRVITLDGKEEYHEVKGWMDDRSKTKIKRMSIYYPEVKLIVIDKKIYKSIEKKAKLFIKEWEV